MHKWEHNITMFPGLVSIASFCEHHGGSSGSTKLGQSLTSEGTINICISQDTCIIIQIQQSISIECGTSNTVKIKTPSGSVSAQHLHM